MCVWSVLAGVRDLTISALADGSGHDQAYHVGCSELPAHVRCCVATDRVAGGLMRPTSAIVSSFAVGMVSHCRSRRLCALGTPCVVGVNDDG